MLILVLALEYLCIYLNIYAFSSISRLFVIMIYGIYRVDLWDLILCGFRGVFSLGFGEGL